MANAQAATNVFCEPESSSIGPREPLDSGGRSGAPAHRHHTRLRKRLRDSAGTSTSPEEGPAAIRLRTEQAQPADDECPLELSLYIQWHSSTGKIKVDHMQLRSIGGLGELEGISKTLVERAFPPGDRPDYLESPDFWKLTPTEDFMSLPGNIARTQFRLAVMHEGWEYVVLERDMGAELDPARSMLVTLIEFESTALMLGALGVRMSLLMYPLVSVKKAFLEDIAKQLKTNPHFQGIL